MITPMDIHNKTFSGQIRGYSKDEVNAFLEELASDYEKIYREHRAMEEEMDIIRTKLRNYEKMESTMSHTLVMAQETADNVKKNAHKEAELSIQEAQSEAQKIVSDAEAARRKMNADLLKAEGDMNLYIEKLLSNFKSALALIEAAKALVRRRRCRRSSRQFLTRLNRPLRWSLLPRKKQQHRRQKHRKPLLRLPAEIFSMRRLRQ